MNQGLSFQYWIKELIVYGFLRKWQDIIIGENKGLPVAHTSVSRAKGETFTKFCKRVHGM